MTTTEQEHAHPTVNRFNRTGQRFLWSDTNDGGLALYRWDPPSGYTPCVMVTHDPSYEFRRVMVDAFTREYPLPCGCQLEPDANVHLSPRD